MIASVRMLRAAACFAANTGFRRFMFSLAAAACFAANTGSACWRLMRSPDAASRLAANTGSAFMRFMRSTRSLRPASERRYVRATRLSPSVASFQSRPKPRSGSTVSTSERSSSQIAAQGFRRKFAASRGQVSRFVSQDHAQDSIGLQRGKVCDRSVIAAPAERNTRITALLYLACHHLLRRHRRRHQTATASGLAESSRGR
jgi:hypothetical protein